MKDILAAAQRDYLARFAASVPLVALDYDGTLAPIVPNRATARMRSGTRRRLDDIVAHYPVAVLSGRAKADVAEKLSGIAVHAVVGNHGAEPESRNFAHERLVARWVAILDERLGGMSGVQIENKTYSIAIHYRKARARRVAEKAIAAAVLELGKEARCFGGKFVENVMPRGAPHKGTALLALQQALRAKTAIYVGDDVTDEDVFALADPRKILCIRVGRSRKTLAPFYIASQERIDELFDVLIARSSQLAAASGAREGRTR